MKDPGAVLCKSVVLLENKGSPSLYNMFNTRPYGENYFTILFTEVTLLSIKKNPEY